MASRSWNRVELIGNLTRDPELRYTPNGAAVATIGLATNRTYVTEGDRKEEVDFHRLVAWNKLAELCNQLLKKGNKVFISGRLKTRTWEAQDGTQRNVTEIVIEDMILLSPKSGGEYAHEEEPIPDVSPVSDVPSTDDKKEPIEKKEESKEEPKVKTPVEEVADDDLPF